jgi:hypothetical protein
MPGWAEVDGYRREGLDRATERFVAMISSKRPILLKKSDFQIT